MRLKRRSYRTKRSAYILSKFDTSYTIACELLNSSVRQDKKMKEKEGEEEARCSCEYTNI